MLELSPLDMKITYQKPVGGLLFIVNEQCELLPEYQWQLF